MSVRAFPGEVSNAHLAETRSLTALVVLGSMLTLDAGQQVPSFTPEQDARLQIREIMDGLYVIPGFGTISPARHV